MSDEIYYDEDRNIIEKPSHEELEATDQVVDAYGNVLVSWDSIISIQSLPVKNGVSINKGEKFTKIKLTNDPGMVVAKHPKNGEMYLKTMFFKKI